LSGCTIGSFSRRAQLHELELECLSYSTSLYQLRKLRSDEWWLMMIVNISVWETREEAIEAYFRVFKLQMSSKRTKTSFKIALQSLRLHKALYSQILASQLSVRHSGRLVFDLCPICLLCILSGFCVVFLSFTRQTIHDFPSILLTSGAKHRSQIFCRSHPLLVYNLCCGESVLRGQNEGIDRTEPERCTASTNRN
jgi:hypothetical protein